MTQMIIIKIFLSLFVSQDTKSFLMKLEIHFGLAGLYQKLIGIG